MTIRLFYSPGACSLVPHIALEEASADYVAVRVLLSEGEHLDPGYLAINPHALVPALAVGDCVITENVAINNYIADRFESDGSVPRGDYLETARCNELLGWFASSVHIAFAQIWRGGRFTDDPAAKEAVIAGGHAAVGKCFDEIEQLCGEGWLVGTAFSAADSYALTFFRWGRRIGTDMAKYPHWAAHCLRVLDRPAVTRTIGNEGLAVSDFVLQ